MRSNVRTMSSDPAASGGIVTVYVTIGNSDDKLTQVEWSDFTRALALLAGTAKRTHGIWFSAPGSQYQNMCVCVEMALRNVGDWQQALGILALRYRQDSIAWAEVDRTAFVIAEASHG